MVDIIIAPFSVPRECVQVFGEALFHPRKLGFELEAVRKRVSPTGYLGVAIALFIAVWSVTFTLYRISSPVSILDYVLIAAYLVVLTMIDTTVLWLLSGKKRRFTKILATTVYVVASIVLLFFVSSELARMLNLFPSLPRDLPLCKSRTIQCISVHYSIIPRPYALLIGSLWALVAALWGLWSLYQALNSRGQIRLPAYILALIIIAVLSRGADVVLLYVQAALQSAGYSV